jgi:hypothetical protein
MNNPIPTTVRTQDLNGNAAEKPQDLIGKITDRAQDIAGDIADRAKDMAHAAGDMAHAAGHKADDITHRAGRAIESLGDTIRDKGPREGTAGSVSGNMAKNLEGVGQYLQEEGISGMANDLANLVRKNPIPALLMGIGIGFMVARATTRRS